MMATTRTQVRTRIPENLASWWRPNLATESQWDKTKAACVDVDTGGLESYVRWTTSLPHYYGQTCLPIY